MEVRPKKYLLNWIRKSLFNNVLLEHNFFTLKMIDKILLSHS